MGRIAVGGFLHESHSFAPRATRYEDFVIPGGFPPLTEGEALFAAMRTASCGLRGAIEAADGHDLVPLAWGFANPAGPVEAEAFERIAGMLCAGLSRALDGGALDGVYLDLHGAAVTERFGDMEGELLRRVRAVVGAVPVAISLDPHANLTADMVALVDAISPYRTYPHVDMPEAGARAMRLLLRRIALGRPFATRFRQLDYLLPITSQCTLEGPMAEVMTARDTIHAETGAAEIAWCFGFPYADFDGCGPAFAVFAEDDAAAEAAADRFDAALARQETAFGAEILPAADAVRVALGEAGPGGPVVIADTQDNPGGGGHGDTTGLLAELVRQGARGAVMCLINDAESAAACAASGEGGTLRLELGGKSDGTPFVCQARVERITDGRFTLTGPMGGGNPGNLGPCALIEVGAGVRVLVVSRKMQALDQAILRHVGVEPAEVPVLALKSSVHFRADYGPIARRVIVAAAPGPVVADPGTLPFRHLRPGMWLRPGANRAG